MKKRILTLTLVVSMLGTMFNGCGAGTVSKDTETTNNTNIVDIAGTDVAPQIDMAEMPRPAEMTDGIKVSELSETAPKTLGDIQLGGEDATILAQFGSEVINEFPGVKGAHHEVRIYEEKNEPEKAYAECNMTFSSGTNLILSWSGRAELGTGMFSEGTGEAFFITDENGDCLLTVWDCASVTDEIFAIYADEAALKAYIQENVPNANVDKYWVYSNEGNKLSYMYAFEEVRNDETHTGYAKIMLNNDLKQRVNVVYTEKVGAKDYDDTLRTIETMTIIPKELTLLHLLENN